MIFKSLPHCPVERAVPQNICSWDAGDQVYNSKQPNLYPACDIKHSDSKLFDQMIFRLSHTIRWFYRMKVIKVGNNPTTRWHLGWKRRLIPSPLIQALVTAMRFQKRQRTNPAGNSTLSGSNPSSIMKKASTGINYYTALPHGHRLIWSQRQPRAWYLIAWHMWWSTTHVGIPRNTVA